MLLRLAIGVVSLGSAMALAAAVHAQQPSTAQGPQCSATRLVGTWERISLLRNGLSVQPPDAPLFVKFSADGYWSMMEMPERPKIDKPLDQQTPKELWSRFERVEGGQGTWTVKSDGSVVTRRHLVNIAPGGEGTNQDRLCTFEGDILALIGTGANRSPQARFRRLEAQPLKSTALVGTWERTSLAIDGKPSPQSAPLVLILGEDGWFSETQLPPGRKPPGKPLEKYTADDYVKSFGGVFAGRGTYSIDGATITRKYVANINPSVIGTTNVRQFSVDGGVLVLRGKTESGSEFEARHQKLTPLDTSAR